MAKSKDPTKALCNTASKLAETESTACNQTGYKVGKKAFLYVGPGAKGVGFKAMFKLDVSMPEARKLAKSQPDRFEVGKTGWVTARFTTEQPLAESTWQKWLAESHKISASSTAPKKKVGKKKSSKSSRRPNKAKS